MKTIEEYFRKYPLFDAILILGIISCLGIASAAPIMNNVANPYRLWMSQAFYYFLGFILLFVVYRIGKDTFYKHIKILYWLFIFLLVLLGVDHQVYIRTGISVLPTAIVPHINGATSWFRIPGFSFQPSEFMKIIMVIALAKMTQEHNEEVLIPTIESDIRYFLKVLKIFIPPAILMLMQNDSGVMLIFAFAAFFVIISSGVNKRWFVVIFTLAILGIGLLVYLFVFQNGIFTKIIKGHTLSRVYGWLDPEGTTANQGMQLWFSQLSYGTAGFFGHGFRNFVKTFPEGQTDFIFAVIASSFGYFGALITIAAIAFFDICVLRIGLHSTNGRDKYFTMGIVGCLLFQQVWNIGMILGLLPITGITLPMLSYGGSSLWSYMFAGGILLDIDYQNKLLDNSHKKY
ncbi:FtsW/RodA/SpoVE family cell cycle protein [Sharpea azabuensis]|uniref:FtsW/RodA/SpoVE family cell cycle protein n=1 Tax=Sharpea azabuensis TaxID=322505 RepID=UPI00051B5D98|nr:FtsW/RodA/SpoVE family cell cycle protein [Sharpea azabuensis]HAJ15417.1 FtsW/RodA/SpoVE family cell cycle protein [Erysipelotrichaceae bacterium]SFE22208.1 rod shape determining protein RodA [Sharpea azabuensis]SFL07704.1 rod shape determining protein RodA [Sharpea azabuensis]HBZ51575.1 FtsW/RodA/SpoVE family cell cycle protein [Erysipelotrichaceae bacterium]HBZ89206.1 FtsW/RodA/SpoVE family cell cycle protein [Erysipelotrichaceae bacterium]